MIIALEAGDLSIPIQILERSEHVSPHTGKTLRRIRGETTAVGEARNDEFQKALRDWKSKPLPEHKNSPAPRSEWLLTSNSHSYKSSSGPQEYHYNVELIEFEKLEPTSVEVGPLSLTPIRYSEESSTGTITIDMIVPVKDADLKPFLTFLEEASRMRYRGEYFRVVRHGISDEPRQMRFGLIWWSKHIGGNKYKMVLVDQAYDQQPESPWVSLNRELHAANNELALYMTMVDGILATLRDRGILSSEKLGALKADAKAQHWSRMHNFFQLGDVEKDD